MDAYENINSRKSIRGFLPKLISKDVFERVIEVAKNCPSYTNTQPWEIVVVSGEKKEELSKKLLKLAQIHAPTSPDLPLPTCWPSEMKKRTRDHGVRRLNTLGIERSNKEGIERLRLMNFRFYNAPYAVFLFMDGSLGDWSLFDMGLFTQNFVLAAHSHGIGSCIQASVVVYSAEIKEFLNVPKEKKLVVCISIGYPDPENKINEYRSTKKKIDEFCLWY